MALLQINQITFQYPDAPTEALRDVSLMVNEGEFIAICGPSGSGKSTLLRLMKRECAPHGRLDGTIRYQGIPLKELPPKTTATAIGMVFQDPDNQIVMETVMEELLFGLENIGLDTLTMRKKIAEIVHFFGLEPLLDRPTYELSGGQKQLINLASVLLMEPRILLLDEPTSQLDPIAAKDFLNMLRRMNEELGIAVVIVEHRLEDVWPIADRVVLLHEGRVIYDDPPHKAAAFLASKADDAFFDYLPSASRLFLHYAATNQNSRLPITVKEARSWIKGLTVRVKEASTQVVHERMKPVVLEAKNIDFQYEKGKPRILDRLSFSLYENEKLAIVGGNGSGKSTMLKVLAGLLKPQRGKVVYQGRKTTGHIHPEIAYMPQNPRLYFSEESVKLELEKAAHDSPLSPETKQHIIDEWGLAALGDRHPYDLSGGEMQKLVFACLLLRGPRVMLIDEPTKGLDPESKKQFGEWLNRFSWRGMSFVIVTHDIEFAADYADRVGMLFRGEVTAMADAAAFFKGNAFYTTSINRITRGVSAPEVSTLKEAYVTWDVQNGSP